MNKAYYRKEVFLMKKIILIFIGLVTMLLMTGCSEKGSPVQQEMPSMIRENILKETIIEEVYIN